EDLMEEVPYNRSAASSFLPVSSYDFFSKSAAIPGLGSPPHPHADVQKRSSLLRDSPSQRKDSPAFRTAKTLDKNEDYPTTRRGIAKESGRDSQAGMSPTEAGRSYRNQSEKSLDARDSRKRHDADERRMDPERMPGDRSREVGQDWETSSGKDSFGRALGGRTMPKDPVAVRQDDTLIAQREAFYREIKEADSPYHRFRALRSRSKSPGSFRSRSGSLKRGGGDPGGRRGRSRSWTHSRSRSPGDRPSPVSKSGESGAKHRSPVITGIKELDRYLGGAKFLIQKAIESEGYSSWKDFTSKGESKEKLENRKSPSPKRFRSQSLSPKRFKSRSSSPKRFKSRSPIPERYGSKFPSAKRYQSRSPSSRRHG
ncbi:hypothetical protein ElyMa_003761200, partial [Elysia marginata]